MLTTFQRVALFRTAPAVFLFLAACGPEPVSVYQISKERAAQERAPADLDRSSATSTPPFQSSGPFSPADIHWATPEGWLVKPASGMRLASMQTPGGGDFSLIALPDSPDLDNVNRWLGQLGMVSVDPYELGEMRETIDTPIGPFHLYQMEGESPDAVSILAAIYRREGNAIFFRLQGTRETIREQRPFFEGLLHGFHFASDHDTGILETAVDTEYRTNQDRIPTTAPDEEDAAY